MPSDIALHLALRGLTALLAMAALGYGVARALRVRGDRWRRSLRAIGAPLLLGIAVLSAIDIVFTVTRGRVPAEDTVEWIWVGLDVLVPIFILLQIESWRRYDRLQAELAVLSQTDPLTGLPNRRGFIDRGLAAMAMACRSGGPCAVMMLDLDRFKAINDGFGHPAGDAVLRGVAVVIGQAVREADLVGRLGGEEFAVMLPGDDLAGALRLADRLRGVVAGGVAHPAGEGARVTFSGGVALLDPAGGVPALENALALADTALYAAKLGGRDRVLAA